MKRNFNLTIVCAFQDAIVLLFLFILVFEIFGPSPDLVTKNGSTFTLPS